MQTSRVMETCERLNLLVTSSDITSPLREKSRFPELTGHLHCRCNNHIILKSVVIGWLPDEAANKVVPDVVQNRTVSRHRHSHFQRAKF